MHRDTFVSIDLNNIKYNVKKVIKNYKYDYYFGVVKADCYGHGAKEVVKVLLDSGINYLAVATLDEALELRKYYKEVPILCLGVIYNEYLNIAANNNVTVTIPSLDYLNSIDINNLKKVHIKINTRMNRLGVKTKEEFNTIFDLLKNVEVEGVYSHIYEASDINKTNKQFENFELITSDNLNKIKIIHISASDALTNYPKKDYINGCRLGIIMYGFNNKLKLKSTFKVMSKVIQINNLEIGETVGYNGIYKANKKEKIAVIPIGYADGIIRKNTGRYVFINNKKYTIVGNICMDMLFVKIDDDVKLYDKVEIIKDNEHLSYIADYLDTITYEVMCEIGKRVYRVYK